MKPHIKLVRKRVWSCTAHDITREGSSPKQAYDRWCYALAALAAPTHVPNIKAHKPAVEPKLVAKVAPKPADSPVVLPAVVPGAAGAATYHESMVQKVHGTPARSAYAPPAGLRRNHQRAAAAQPPLKSISSSSIPFRGWID